ncbi:MAG: hypothetical protein ACFFDP_11900 [Promethearchaeota archaeon]
MTNRNRRMMTTTTTRQSEIKQQGVRLLRMPGGSGRLLHGPQRRLGGGGGMSLTLPLKQI